MANLSLSARSQTKFDVISFTAPRGYEQIESTASVAFKKVDGEKFCVMRLFKPIEGGSDLNANFDANWESIAKKSVAKILGAPQKDPVTDSYGWKVMTGRAGFSDNAIQGVVILITAVGGGKVANVLVVTNSDDYLGDVKGFVSSLQLPQVTASQATAVSPLSPVPAPEFKGSVDPASFGFRPTKWDDGAVATLNEDGVVVTRGPFTFHLYHLIDTPKARNESEKALTYWHNIVAKHYAAPEPEYPAITSSVSDSEINVPATEKSTGKRVFLKFLLVDVSMQGPYVHLIAAPDQATVDKQFGRNGAERVFDLSRYNKFAINSAADLVGSWNKGGANGSITSQGTTSAGGGFVWNNYTGQKIDFTFTAGGAFTSLIMGSSALAGKGKTFMIEDAGQYRVENDWIIVTVGRKGTDRLNAWFKASRDGKVLILKDYQAELRKIK